MRRVLATLVLVFACARKPAAPTPPDAEKPIDDTAERSSVVSLAHGSCVAWRSGEALLDLSAVRAIDGEPVSHWQAPPKDVPQSTIIALQARSLIRRVGVRTGSGIFAAHRISFESSADGTTFQPLVTVTAATSSEPQWWNVTPAAATHLRVSMLDLSAAGREPRIYSVLAQGDEEEPPHPGSIAGSWSINGVSAAFAQRGAHVTGVMQLGAQPIRFEGGSDGRVYRLAWVRGNDYGLAAIAVSPDSEHLSGIEWHEEAIPLFYGDSWYGERSDGKTAPPAESIAVAHLRRVGRFPLFDVDLDQLAQLIAGAPAPLRLVAHQFRERDDAANLARAQRELAALKSALAARGVNLSRLEFVAAGAANPRQNPVTELMRAMYSSIDLEIRR